MATSSLVARADEVADLVFDQATEWIGHNGVVGGALSVRDPNAEMPFVVRLFLDCQPAEVADRLPANFTVDLPHAGRLQLPVESEFTGEFTG